MGLYTFFSCIDLLYILLCISVGQLDALLSSAKYVAETAVACDADSNRFPREWIFHVRWGKKGTKLQNKVKTSTGKEDTLVQK